MRWRVEAKWAGCARARGSGAAPSVAHGNHSYWYCSLARRPRAGASQSKSKDIVIIATVGGGAQRGGGAGGAQ
eukprot:6389982-Prymnesium_polylepis.1